MKKIIHLGMVLLIVAAAATASLALTYQITAPEIARGEQQEKENALGAIFFNGYERVEVRRAQRDDKIIEYYAVFVKKEDPEPTFYALIGKGLGYNKSVPIELLVGFNNPKKTAAVLLDGEKVDGLLCAGWRVVKSQETPGLGENAKQQAAAFTWWQLLTGSRHAPMADKRTDFQKQFANKNPATMAVKKNIDIITGATITTNGIVNAIKDAATNLQAILDAP